MPIRINLLAEAQAEEDLRRRDPVKRSLIVGGLLVGAFIVWFSSIVANNMWEGRRLTQINNEIQTRTNEFSQVLSNKKKADDIQKRIDALNKLSAVRFLQGNMMDAFQKIYSPNVQITRLRMDQTYAVTAGSAAVTNNFGVVPGKLGTATERITLFVDARDSSMNPGDQVNQFKDAITKQEFFKSVLATNGVRLSNLSAPQSTPDSRPFVMFTLECRFPDKTR